LIKTTSDRRLIPSCAVFLIVYCIVFSTIRVPAQSSAESFALNAPPNDLAKNEKPETETGFRVEKVPVAGGGELITIFAKQSRSNESTFGPATEIPMISVLRDTLGDDLPENDRLRYVWMHNYTKASLVQKLSAFAPILYSRTSNKKNVGTEAPPPVIDVQSSDKVVWNKVFWLLFKNIVLSEVGLGMKTSTLHYRQNAFEYQQSAVARAMTVLSLYQEIEGEKVLSDSELKDIQARLSLNDKPFGWHVQSENLGRVYDKELTKTRDFRGHNWELLRQYSEAQGLYFEPLEMPDGAAQHALVWVDAADIEANKGKKFDARFLNIKNPWTDSRLAKWSGYSQQRWFDADNRQVEPETPNAKSRLMIPLALYGLDNPKIPVILVDFRDNGNPKIREMSRRLLNEIIGNVLPLTRFGGLPFFVGRLIYSFITGRRGIDLNQASRLRSYSQLKLLLSLDASLDPEFRTEIAKRIESATLNPLQNGLEAEARLAHTQYANLLAYAKRPDGLPKKITQDRREEMVRLTHGGVDRALLSIAHAFSFGLITHREKETPKLLAQLDIRRQLDYHERYLREVAYASANPEVDSDVVKLRRSLSFIAENGAAAEDKTSRALAKIFAITTDIDMRSLCLSALYKVNNSSAKNELLAIYKNSTPGERWHDLCARYLKLALVEGQRISYRDAQVIAGIGTN